MPFSASDPDHARRAAAKSSSVVTHDPSEAGRRSWAHRDPRQVERTTKALLAAADHKRAGEKFAELARNPVYAAELKLWLMVGAERAKAKREGREPEQFYRLVPYDGPRFPPGLVKTPGRRKRKGRT
jgi:hypothetical protein